MGSRARWQAAACGLLVAACITAPLPSARSGRFSQLGRERASAGREVAEDVGRPRLARRIDGAVLESVRVELPGGAELGQPSLVRVDPITGAVACLEVVDADGERWLIAYEELCWLAEDRVLLEREPDAEPLDAAPLFGDAERTEITGEIEHVQSGSDSRLGAVVLKVRDRGNILHRVWLEAGGLVTAHLPSLRIGGTVGVAGVFTRDRVGKLLVASRVRANGREVRLRDESGACAWETLAERFPSTEELAQVDVAGEDARLESWTFDRVTGRIDALRVRSADGERALAWRPLGRDRASLRLDLADGPPVEPEGPRVEEASFRGP